MERQDYKVIEDNGGENIKIKCSVCGVEKIVTRRNFIKQSHTHSKRNCKEGYYKNLVGKVVNDYTCIGYKKVGAAFKKIMKCNKCGHIEETNDERSVLKHNLSRCKRDFIKAEIGKVYGDYKIIEIYKNSSNCYMAKWECTKCKTVGVNSYKAVARHTLKHSKNCIKFIPESDIKRAIVYRFGNIVQRCENPQNENYKHYGARGIKCKYKAAIDLYKDFADELAEKAKIYGIRNATFDRIDVNGDYEKNNIRITTMQVQNTNTTRQRFFIIEKGDSRILSNNGAECSRAIGASESSIGNVVAGRSKTCKGWRLVRILDGCENIDQVVENEGVTTKLIVG